MAQMGTWSSLLLLLAVQVNHLRADRAEDPEQLAARLIGESCNLNNFTAFYLHIRDLQNMTRRFPAWPNGELGKNSSFGALFTSKFFDQEFRMQELDIMCHSSNYISAEDTGLPGVEIFWSTGESYDDISPSYDTFWGDYFSVSPSFYTW